MGKNNFSEHKADALPMTNKRVKQLYERPLNWKGKPWETGETIFDALDRHSWKNAQQEIDRRLRLTGTVDDKINARAAGISRPETSDRHDLTNFNSLSHVKDCRPEAPSHKSSALFVFSYVGPNKEELNIATRVRCNLQEMDIESDLPGLKRLAYVMTTVTASFIAAADENGKHPALSPKRRWKREHRTSRSLSRLNPKLIARLKEAVEHLQKG